MARGKGEGTRPKLRKDGRYVCHVTVGGKRRYFYGASTKAAADAMKDWLESPEARDPSKFEGQQTVGDVINAYLRRIEISKKDRTYRSYESVARIHIIPRLGKVDALKLTGRHVAAMLDEMATAKVSRRKKNVELVGARTRELAYIVVGAAFKVLRPDLLDNVAKPKYEAAEIHPWTPELRDQFVSYLDTAKPEYSILFRLLLSTGMRIGEALALTLGDLDFVNKRISIAKTYNPKAKRSEIPKTKKSRRTIPMTEDLRKLLRDHIMASGRRGTARLFEYDETHVAKKLKQAMRAARVPVITPHDLRHTFATVALKRGVPPKVVAAFLGHSSIKITIDTYSHILPGMMESAVELINSVAS